LGVLHARQVLDGTGDTHGDVQLRRDDLAGLTDLHVVGHETGVHRSAGRTDSGTQLVGQAVEQLEIVAVLHAAPAGDDDLGSGQFRTIGLGQLFANEYRLARITCARDLLDGSGTTFSRHRIEARGTHGDHLDGGRGLYGGN